MALKNFKFAQTSEKLGALLNYALTGIVQSNLDRLDMPGMTSSLDLLYKHRGLGYEDEVEFYFLPHASGIEGAPIDFVVISDLLFNPGEAGLYAYGEFAQNLYLELLRQSEGDSMLRDKALRLIEKFNLQKFANTCE